MQWRGLVRRIPRPKLLATVASLFAIYLLLGFFSVPRYIKGAIPEQVAQHLKRQASVGEVRFNPLLFKLEIGNFVLYESDGTALAGFRHLLVDFELSSLLRWAWTFSTIALDGFYLRVDIAPDGRLNLAALADSLPKSEAAPAPDAKPPRLVLQHIELSDGAITFSDRSGARPRFDTLRPLALELRDISTLPDRRGPYSVTARLPGGGTLAWRGEVSLQPIFSLGEIKLSGARGITAWRFFQDKLNLAEPEGEADIGLRYRVAYTDATPEVTVDDIGFTARDIALTAQGAKEPFFALKTANIAGGRFDLAQRELHLPSIELRGGVIRAEADADGVLNLQKLVKDQDRPPSPLAVIRPHEPPWRVKLESVRVGDVALQYRDLSRAAPLAAGIGALDAGLSASLETGAGDTQVVVNGIAVTLSRITLGEAAKEPLITLNTVGLEGGSVDLRAQRLAARRVAVKGARRRLSAKPTAACACWTS